jgi:hypothetical protein
VSAIRCFKEMPHHEPLHPLQLRVLSDSEQAIRWFNGMVAANCRHDNVTLAVLKKRAHVRATVACEYLMLLLMPMVMVCVCMPGGWRWCCVCVCVCVCVGRGGEGTECGRRRATLVLVASRDCCDVSVHIVSPRWFRRCFCACVACQSAAAAAAAVVWEKHNDSASGKLWQIEERKEEEQRHGGAEWRWPPRATRGDSPLCSLPPGVGRWWEQALQRSLQNHKAA